MDLIAPTYTNSQLILQINKITKRREQFRKYGVAMPSSGAHDFSEKPDWEAIHKRHPRFEYFEREALGSGFGREYLILKSSIQQDQIPKDMNLHPEDTRLHLKIGQMLEGCSRRQRDILGDILLLTVKSATRIEHEIPDGRYSIPIPTSGQQLRRQFVSNKYSLLNNIPHPTVSNLTTYGIAKCTLSDCLANFLAVGVDFQTITQSRENPNLQEILRRNADVSLTER